MPFVPLPGVWPTTCQAVEIVVHQQPVRQQLERWGETVRQGVGRGGFVPPADRRQDSAAAGRDGPVVRAEGSQPVEVPLRSVHVPVLLGVGGDRVVPVGVLP